MTATLPWLDGVKLQRQSGELRPIEGTGAVHSWVRLHRPVFPSLKDLVPFDLVLVRLDEQPDILIPGRFAAVLLPDRSTGLMTSTLVS